MSTLRCVACPALFLVVAPLLGTTHTATADEVRKPNIILILADDLGYGDLGCFGQETLKTPHLDRMASEGIRFTQFYAGCTVCAPSRSVLMTGRHMGRTTVRGNSTEPIVLQPGQPTLATMLKSAGYKTACVGKWGIGTPDNLTNPNDVGFDHFYGYVDMWHAHNFYPEFLIRNGNVEKLDNEVSAKWKSEQDPSRPRGGRGVAVKRNQYAPDLFIEESLKFIRENKDDPFFLYFAMNVPHANNEAGNKGVEVPNLGEFANQDWPESEKGFAAMIRNIDRDTGRILDLLKELKLDENTLVIFSSDNGPHEEGGHDGEFFDSNGKLRGFKRDLTEGGIRVPTIAWWPKTIKADSSDNAHWYFGDMMATFADVADATPPKDIDSESFEQTLRGKPRENRWKRSKNMYWEFYEKGSVQAVRFGKWKAIRKPMFDGPIQLFDMSNDDSEMNDYAERRPDLKAHAKNLLDKMHEPDPKWKIRPNRKVDRPNVLFIAVDDLNHWVGHLNRNPQTITPNVDRLAARGVSFTRAYCAAPACNPSRAALMGGMRPSTTGVYHNPDDYRPHIRPEQTLNSYFRRNGYLTLGAGKIYHGSFGRRSEWDDYGKRRGKTTGSALVEKNIGGIRWAQLKGGDDSLGDYHTVSYCIDKLKQENNQPLFLACGIFRPHMPWSVPKKYFDMHPLDEIKLPPHLENDLDDLPPAGRKTAKPNGDHKAITKAGAWKEAVQAYLASITYADTQLGRLLDALDKSPAKDNTIIVLWGDHGWHLGEKQHWRKFTLWEEATRAPLIWVVPGTTPKNELCHRTVDFMSIYPTLCEVAGLRTPNHCDGVSIASLLKNPDAEWNRPAVTTHGYQRHAVRSERFRYIRYDDGSEELYDEVNDPYEWKNLASDPNYANDIRNLAKWLPKRNHEPHQRK